MRQLQLWAGGLAMLAFLVTVGPSAVSAADAPKVGKFPIPDWHPDARWEVEDPFAGSVPGFLDGPHRESQPFAGKVDFVYGPTQAGRNVLLSYDPESEFVHIAAGVARGYLDGPFSQARFGRNDYTARPRFVASPDRRYYYLMDVENQRALRRCDLENQEVTTIRRTVKNFGGMTVDDKGNLLIIDGAELHWLDPAGKQEKSVSLKLEVKVSGIGGAGASRALDEVHGRLYATAIGPTQWYVWYWDLKDGSFHGVLPVPTKGIGRKRNEAGPFAGTDLYAVMTKFLS